MEIVIGMIIMEGIGSSWMRHNWSEAIPWTGHGFGPNKNVNGSDPNGASLRLFYWFQNKGLPNSELNAYSTLSGHSIQSKPASEST